MRKLLLAAGGIILAASLTITVSGCGNVPCSGDGGVKDSWQIENTKYYICNDNTTQEVYLALIIHGDRYPAWDSRRAA